MADVKLLLDGVELVEERGSVVSLTQKALVSGLVQEPGPALLQEVLAAPGLPAEGDSPLEFPNLTLVARRIQFIPKNITKVYVHLEYQAISLANIDIVWEGNTSVREISTPNDRWSINGIPRQITVQHTFPPDDPDFGTDSPYAGQELSQGGQVNVYMAQTTLRGTGTMQVDAPHLLARQHVGALNRKRWAGSGGGTWLCTSFNFKEMDRAVIPVKYEITVEFSQDLNRWEPYALFSDPRDGLPPPDLVLGKGRKFVDWYPYWDFNETFPTDFGV